eukprot:1718108-Pleurochrysis_carterae.AAC.1
MPVGPTHPHQPCSAPILSLHICGFRPFGARPLPPSALSFHINLTRHFWVELNFQRASSAAHPDHLRRPPPLSAATRYERLGTALSPLALGPLWSAFPVRAHLVVQDEVGHDLQRRALHEPARARRGQARTQGKKSWRNSEKTRRG